jgi:hypothetical protein
VEAATMRKSLVVTLFVVFAVEAGISQKAVSKHPDKITIAIENVKQLLLTMEAKNGKISKEEWMRFMEAEFDKLDTEKKGEVDLMEIRQSFYVKQARFSDLGR